MASHERGSPTIYDSISITWQLLVATGHAIARSVWPTQAYKNAQWPWRRILAVQFLRAARGLTANNARHASQPTTGEAIRSFCKKSGLKVTSHAVSCNEYPSATLHEVTLDTNPHEQVFVYFHGGGYRNPMRGDGHMPVVLDSAKALGAGRIFLLEYGLTPQLKYPGQLYQAACALNVLFEQHGCTPNQTVLGGDSAGGNLVLAALAHTKQAHPLVPAIKAVGGDSKLRGALLISPWVTNTWTARSFEGNSDEDYLSREAMEGFTQLWDPKPELWADFLQAPGGFWETLPVSKVLITVGSFEVFRDDVNAFATMLGGKADADAVVKFVETPAEVHVQPAVDSALGLPWCKSFLEVLLWCRSLA